MPDTAATQLIAPLGQIFAVGLVLGLYVAARRSGGRFLTVGFVAKLIALMGLVGVAFVINLVFSYLPEAEIDELIAGPLGIALIAISVLFILASLAFVAGLWSTGTAPRVPLALYAVAAIPIGLRAFVPETVLEFAIALLAAALVWLAAALWQRTAVPAT